MTLRIAQLGMMEALYINGRKKREGRWDSRNANNASGDRAAENIEQREETRQPLA
ncbi:hypothetical protein [Bacillus xiapuensis]|uniref:hypothetical protein n=1 Tax=Bacillus xiapuensis TaxID=2014075 RepID=UPI001E5244FA|nr:hypothetical protein [Bacillus xiapuensis]